MRYIAFVALSLVSLTVQSEVPYVFKAGEPARAEEVNENFSYLEGLISNGSDFTSGAEPSDDGCTNQDDFHSISYVPKASYIGQEFTVLGKSYKAIDIPVKEFGSGALYRLRLLADYDGSEGVNISVMAAHAMPDSPECQKISVSNYPAELFFYNETRVFDANTIAQNPEVSSYVRSSGGLRIQIGETIVSVDYWARVNEFSHPVEKGTYDFVGNSATEKMSSHKESIDAVDDLVDYVSIERVN